MSTNNDIEQNKNDCKILCNFCTYPIDACSTKDEDVICPHCGHKNKIKHDGDTSKTFIFALTALILYVPANIFPFMTIEMYGQKNQSNIWQGIVTLAHGGSLLLGITIFIASMLVPFIKLVSLFYLSATAKNGHNQKFKTKLFHFIEVIGPWSMLDVFLLAVLVAIVKFGEMASVSPGLGSYLFLFVVIFTMFASASFDPKTIWEKGIEDGKDSKPKTEERTDET